MTITLRQVQPSPNTPCVYMKYISHNGLCPAYRGKVLKEHTKSLPSFHIDSVTK